MKKVSVAVIGAGKVGSALAVLLRERGYPIVGVASRSRASAEALAGRLGCTAYAAPEEAARTAELVFITTPDREIAAVSAQIAERGGFYPGQVVAHTSGAHSAGELRGVREAGALAVSIHPLQSIAGVQAAVENLPGSYFALEGDDAAIPLAEQIVRDLGGRSFIIRSEDKLLYHAAACIASNYLVSLLHWATGLYGRFGLSRAEAFEALFPLVQGTINNVRKMGPVEALTGPVSRGDAPTVADHLRAFADSGAPGEELYRQLGLYTVEVALEKGTIDSGQAEELRKIFKGGASR